MSLKTSLGDADVRQNPHPHFSDLVHVLPAAVYMCDADGIVTAYNEAAAELWGKKPIIGKDVWWASWRMYTPEGNPLLRDESPMSLALKTRQPMYGQEIIVERTSGDRFNILPLCRPLYDDVNGNFSGAINVLVETGRQDGLKRSDNHRGPMSAVPEAANTHEDRYHQMVAEVEDYAIILLSREGIIENWNKGAEKIKGYTEHEVVGRSFKIFYPPDDLATGLPDRLLQEALTRGKATHEGWRLRKDGTRFWGSVSLTALRDTAGALTGFAKVIRDLTERRNHELRLQQYADDLKIKNELLHKSEERYHRMVSEVEDYVIILLSPEGIIENWNRGAEKIKGYSAEEVLGKHFSMFYPQGDRKTIPQRLIAEAEKNGRALHEGWRIKKDGTSFWGSTVLTALHSEEGALIGFTKVTRDLTEKKATEERLIATSLKLAEKNQELERINEELSSFAYISSHDLQEPLRKIQTFSHRIMELEFDNLSEKGKDYFQRMQRGASRMQKLIRDILAYSRTTTSEKTFELTDLNDLLAQAKVELEVLITEKNAIIETGPLPKMKIIPFQMQQLFNNLINNALKFSKPDVRPRVEIRCEVITSSAISSSYTGPASELYHLTFRDNGIGFEPIYARKIFEVFQRLHGRSEYGGTGIGLAICKKIVENHHGFINAEGFPNQGATFHIYLPVIA